MGCPGCNNPNLGKGNSKAERKTGTCRVCELMGINKNEARVVEYCYLCDAWICDECTKNYLYRGLSWLYTKLGIKSLN